ncbi:MAG: hypothetical protein R3A48_11220 [Polyangiales bacterium]
MPVLDARRRQPIDVEAWVLARRTRDQVRSRAVIVECKGCAVFGRMIAIRLPKPQAKKARRRLLKIVHQLLSAALLPITLNAFLGLAPSIAERLRSNHPPSRPAALAAYLEFLRKCVA